MPCDATPLYPENITDRQLVDINARTFVTYPAIRLRCILL